MNQYLKRNYTIIKNNIAMIALIPTFAGGLLQLIKLGLISVSMIRFFSISQLVTDGIIILLFLSFPILIFITLFLNQGLLLIYTMKQIMISKINLYQY